MSNRASSIFFLIFTVVLTVAVFAGIVLTSPANTSPISGIVNEFTIDHDSKVACETAKADHNLIKELTDRIVGALETIWSHDADSDKLEVEKETSTLIPVAAPVETEKSVEAEVVKEEVPVKEEAQPVVTPVIPVVVPVEEVKPAVSIAKVEEKKISDEERTAAIVDAVKLELSAIIASEYANMKDSLVETIAPVVADNVYEKVEKDMAAKAEPTVEAYLNKETVAPIIQSIIDDNRELFIMDTVDLVIEQLGLEKVKNTNQVISAPSINSVRTITNEAEYEQRRSGERTQAIDGTANVLFDE